MAEAKRHSQRKNETIVDADELFRLYDMASDSEFMEDLKRRDSESHKALKTIKKFGDEAAAGNKEKELELLREGKEFYEFDVSERIKLMPLIRAMEKSSKVKYSKPDDVGSIDTESEHFKKLDELYAKKLGLSAKEAEAKKPEPGVSEEIVKRGESLGIGGKERERPEEYDFVELKRASFKGTPKVVAYVELTEGGAEVIAPVTSSTAKSYTAFVTEKGGITPVPGATESQRKAMERIAESYSEKGAVDFGAVPVLPAEVAPTEEAPQYKDLSKPPTAPEGFVPKSKMKGPKKVVKSDIKEMVKDIGEDLEKFREMPGSYFGKEKGSQEDLYNLFKGIAEERPKGELSKEGRKLKEALYSEKS